MNSNTNEARDLDFDMDSVNGLILCKYLLPEEVIIKLLSFVSWKDLLSCRLVCQSWKTLIDSIVCLEKLKLDHAHILKKVFIGTSTRLKTNDISFYVCFAIGHNVFGVNHLKNSFGEGMM